ncbi:MAG: hypothetical protein OXE95_09860 [Chloroflexi bacterium]|nr:hypothetical protein [Chloroflexota bacterium]MCY4247864.1 hypothetical protein [Chloroflexota bacterium]
MIRVLMALLMLTMAALPVAAQTPNARSFSVSIADCEAIFGEQQADTYAVYADLVLPRNFWGVQAWTLEVRYKERGKPAKVSDAFWALAESSRAELKEYGIDVRAFDDENGSLAQHINTWTPGQQIRSRDRCMFAGGQSFHVRAWAINNETGERAKLGRARVTLP